MMILKYKRIFLTISTITILLVIGAISFFGFNFSVDFKGGSIYEIQYQENTPLLSEVKDIVKESGLGVSSVQMIGDDSFLIKTPELKDENKIQLEQNLTFDQQYQFIEKQSKTIGPAISSELARKSLFAILFVSIAIVFFIAYTFGRVSKPVSSFKFGIVAVIALIHDILIPTGIFVTLGYFFVSYQIDVLFVTAILAILGFSVNDTIVVFDRIRENLAKALEKKEKVSGDNFEKIVGKSLNQTIVRSVNTSLTTLIILLFLFFIGSEATKSFSLVLIIGVLAGTYSSIFIASPLLVYIEKYQKEKIVKAKKVARREDDGTIDPSDITI